MNTITPTINVSNNIYRILKYYLQIPSNEINQIILKAPYSYKRFIIEKRDGGKRIVWQPSKETKVLQICLLNCVFKNFEINDFCFSYRRGVQSPLKKNAAIHKNYKYSIHLDYKNFFETITPEMFFKSIEYASEKSKIVFSNDEKKLIEMICFISRFDNKNLVIGAPTSPIISNIYMKQFDDFFCKYSSKKKDSYTRYADDLWYSSNNLENVKIFKNIVIDYCAKIDYYSPLYLNNKKTKILNLKHGKKITGLVITENSEIKVPRALKIKTKKLIYELSKNKTNESEIKSNKNILRGYISYIKDNEPSYINKLIMKYGPDYYVAINSK